MILRPMLAPNDDYSIQRQYYRFPCYASPKVDGIRCYTANGKALTRSGKPQPNPYVRSLIEGLGVSGLDGELVTGDFRKSTSELRRTWGEPEFKYLLFDYWADEPFKVRLAGLESLISILPSWCIVLPQRLVYSMEDLHLYEDAWLSEGYEGAMLKDPNGLYKFNRSTLREGLLLKVKRYTDSEATIIGFYEQEANLNDPFTNELGTTSRSSCQENKVGKDTLGGIIVRDLNDGREFRLGSGIGWTNEWRQEVWRNQSNYLGRIITYKSLPHGGYDLPRNASMKGFRDEWDMGG